MTRQAEYKVRRNPFGVLRIFSILLILIPIFLAGFILFNVFIPKAVFLRTEPGGASAYANDKLFCAATPCRITLKRFLPKRIVITHPKHHPYTVNLPAFGMGWDELMDTEFVLKPLISEADMAKAMAACEAERAKAPDPDNIDAEPCLRVPPSMPPLARQSGHCHMAFDVTEYGKTDNVRIAGCTEPVFESSALQAVEQWVYLPKLKNGKAVKRPGVENRLSFRLTDERGVIILEPARFRDNPDHTH